MLTILRLPVAWATVAIFLLAGKGMADAGLLVTIFFFLWLLGVILWSAFGVVHEAEELAHRLGEPFGTLILTLSVIIIEVALIAATMLAAHGVPTLGRDTMFAVLMIVLNGVAGLGLLLGGFRYRQQSYNLQGAAAYLAVIIPLSIIALVLPNFTQSTAAGTLSPLQALLFPIFTLALYGIFLWLQTGRHRGFFAEEDGGAHPHHHVGTYSRPLSRVVVALIAHILPVVILAKSLARLLDAGIAAMGAPTALGGVLIAMIVLAPEGISALRAVQANQLTRAINLCLGTAASTLGLTVPAMLLIGFFTGTRIVLGVAPADMVLLAMTLILSTLTFSGVRTNMLAGAVHLLLFFVFLTLIFSP